MSSRRGSHNRRPRNSHHQNQQQTDENLKPHENPSSSSSLPPLEPRTNNNNRRNSRWAPRNQGPKPQIPKNSEEKGKEEEDESFRCSNNNGGNVPRSKLDENCVSGLVSELNLGTCSSSNGDFGKVEKEEKRVEEVIVDVSNSCDRINEDADEGDVVVERLEEIMRMSVEEETEISEEVMSINNQLQEDELLVMESIYGDNIFTLDNKNGLKCFQTHIHIEVPNGIGITAKLNSDKDSTDFSYSFRVEHIPPIILTCLLPKSYPSNHAPYFSISVQWLSSAKISDLCSKLDSIWQAQAGQEVIYQWVEWLQSCALSHLGFNDEIILGPYGVRLCNEDRRVISRSVSPDIDIPLLKSYNDEQRHENFCRNIQECCICFSEFPGLEFIRLPCQHFFCLKCMKTFSDMHITEGTVMMLQCPESKCGGMIPPGLLKRFIGEEMFERWESLTLQKTLESMSDLFYCPRCETACLEDGDNHAQCSKCYYSFCTLCMDRRHVGIQCLPPEMKLAILQERQSSNALRSKQRSREADMINELLSVKEINRFAKRCPSCKMAVSRTEGCNKIVCQCGIYFCYMCTKEISGYEHYRDGECVLFPAAEIRRWDEMMNGRQVVGQIQAQMFPAQGHPCPLCRQINAKMGNNNHIFCWACQTHYCYLCRKVVKKSTQHFGPKGCKQHTAG